MMKYLFTLLFLLLLEGCSAKNAYSFFTMNQDEELYETNTLNAKIQTNKEVLGIISVTYLNNVDLNLSKKQEKFLVSIYLKQKNKKYHFTLDGKNPLSITPISHDNKYKKLLQHQAQWNKNFIVSFPQTSNDLNLTFYTYPSVSVPINFSKE